jgi:hypothetical protein
MYVDNREFGVFAGINASNGTLLLPDKAYGASLYENTVWIHRLWKSGWLHIEIGNTIDILGKTYIVTDVSYIDYGVYPEEGYGIQYIASCYSKDGDWAGIALYKLKEIKVYEKQ